MATAFRSSRAARNARFANRARGFVKRALALPGFPILPVSGAAATVILIVVGAFGTGQMPLPMRIGFWAVLMAWNTAKWQLWFALLIRRPQDWPRVSAIGAIVINLPLPLEISAALALFGIAATPQLSRTWVEALAISGALFAVMAVLGLRRVTDPEPAGSANIQPGGLLARAGVLTPAILEGVEAEDHYCRLHLAGGRSVLVHHRFGDALTEIATFDGAQLHRGAWAAAHGVRGAVRDGRRWRIVLAGGAQLPVSARFAATARARGWLHPPFSSPGE